MNPEVQIDPFVCQMKSLVNQVVQIWIYDNKTMCCGELAYKRNELVKLVNAIFCLIRVYLLKTTFT